MDELIGAVELGGTKVIAAVARDPLAPLRRTRIPTTGPKATLGAVAEFFCAAEAELGPLQAMGIGAFGPIDLRPDSPHWGRLGRTPKRDWEGANLVAGLQGRIGCPASLDTDVNAAALAEARWGAGRGLGSVAYLTVGTGIGGGLVIERRAVRGAMHPEVGHVRIKRHASDDYRSRCAYHEDCAEGLASGPAIMDRFGKTLAELEPDHPFHHILADYLGQLCATLVLVMSPERIVIGGGVMTNSPLHAAIGEAMLRWLGGYVEPDWVGGFIVPPALGDSAGLAGGFALAQDLLRRSA